jgi:hypothetical protein
MHINAKNILSAALFAALTVPTTLSFADDGLEPSVDSQETVVISLAADPQKGPEKAEPACVALQIGMNLLMDNLGGVEVTPADSVILFLTLDGVELVARDYSKLDCRTPAGPNAASLSGLLNKFVNDLGGEVVICPLCWAERGYVDGDQTHGIVGDAFDIHDLFLHADKVIDF